MSSTYSPILRSELIGAGDQAGTWGSTTNSNFQYIFESAIAGYVAVTVSPTSNTQILTYVNGPSASPALDQSVYAILKLNAGTLGANFNIFAPPVSKTYVIWNNTAYTATFYNSTVIGNTTAAGSGAVIPAGAKVWIWSDGTSFYGNDTAVGNFNVAGNLTVTGTSSFVGVPTAPTASFNTNTTQIATTAFVLSNGVPAGTVMMYASVNAPVNWLFCNGAAVSRTTYATLFAQIGTLYGAGDGSTTFNLPNFNDRMPIGSSTNYNLGTTGGSKDAIVVSHAHTASSGGQSADHNHSGTTGGQSASHYHNLNVDTGSAFYGQSTSGGPATSGFTGGATTALVQPYTQYASNDHNHNFTTNGPSNNHNHTITVDAQGSSGTNANLPPYLAINYIIKYT